MIYLDNNATTKPLDEVVEAVSGSLREGWENPSSVHRGGQSARQLVELARRDVARLIGCSTRELVFTSGATESIDAALRGAMLARPGTRVILTSRVEHEAVRSCAEAIAAESGGRVEVRWLALMNDRSGRVDVGALSSMLDDRVGVVSVQWANNETGVVQPIERIGELCRARGIAFHTDATQWVGRMPCDVSGMAVDLLSFSGHKFHGPKGVGGLFVRRGARWKPMLHGTQEMERRGGTENVPGIVGLGVASRAALEWVGDASARERLAGLRDRFERRVLELVPRARVNGPSEGSARLWTTTNIGFERLEAEALLLLLSERGVYASAGAACSSGSLDPSPVLLAMGIDPEVAHGSLRFSVSRLTTAEDLERAAEIVSQCVLRAAGVGESRVLGRG